MNKGIQYIQVAPCISLKFGGHESYTYHVDGTEQIVEGAIVRIPFGKRNVTGVIIKIGTHKPHYSTKQISKITDVVLTAQQLEFAHWISEHAHGGLGYTLRLFVL